MDIKFCKPDSEIMEHSNKMAAERKKADRKAAFWEWLKDKGVDLLAVIISVIALIRTF